MARAQICTSHRIDRIEDRGGFEMSEIAQPSPKGPQVDIRTKVSRLEKLRAQLIAITAVDLADGNFELIYSFFSKSELVNLRFRGVEGGLLIMPSSNIVAPLRKSSTPETPRTRTRKEATDADH